MPNALIELPCSEEDWNRFLRDVEKAILAKKPSEPQKPTTPPNPSPGWFQHMLGRE